jgi:5,10-methylenetetrahydrofolate reductase
LAESREKKYGSRRINKSIIVYIMMIISFQNFNRKSRIPSQANGTKLYFIA